MPGAGFVVFECGVEKSDPVIDVVGRRNAGSKIVRGRGSFGEIKRCRARRPAGKSSSCGNREEMRSVLPEGRSRSRSTSRTCGSADRISFASCSQDGLSGRPSSGASQKFVE